VKAAVDGGGKQLVAGGCRLGDWWLGGDSWWLPSLIFWMD
jgi:hypothetical protein